MRQMKLIGFMQAQNCSNYPASWRHRLSQPNFGSREYYEGIGRTLEGGKFHLAFFDDRLAIPDKYADDFQETVRYGIRAAKRLGPCPSFARQTCGRRGKSRRSGEDDRGTR